MGKHTTGWTNIRIKLKLIPGRGLPAMICEAYEFIPQTHESARQFQYFKDHKTGLSQRREKPSPPLGMMQIEQEDIKRYSKYLDDIVEHHFRAFAQMYCSDDEYDFQLRLLEFIRDLKPESKDEVCCILTCLLPSSQVNCCAETTTSRGPAPHRGHLYHGPHAST